VIAGVALAASAAAAGAEGLAAVVGVVAAVALEAEGLGEMESQLLWGLAKLGKLRWTMYCTAPAPQPTLRLTLLSLTPLMSSCMHLQAAFLSTPGAEQCGT